VSFYTEGVRLVVEGSPVLDLLRALEARGVRLVVGSASLAHYGLTDSVKARIVGGMPDIVEARRRAEKVSSV